MIYITGDTHIPLDIRKLNTKNFPEQKKMTKKDNIIIAGDFGGVWNCGAEDLYWLKWLENKPFTTLFIDGNHENFDLLNNSFDVTCWNGGKVHKINKSVIHLMRGQVFDIDGLKIFTMGGGESIDKASRKVGKPWWEQELPSEEEYGEACENLNKHGWKVDYVITHTTSMYAMEQMSYIKEKNALNWFLNDIEKRLEFRHWYFGHFHQDIKINEKQTAVYREIISVEVDGMDMFKV